MSVERYLVMVVRRYGERKEGWRKVNERKEAAGNKHYQYRSEIAQRVSAVTALRVE